MLVFRVLCRITVISKLTLVCARDIFAYSNGTMQLFACVCSRITSTASSAPSVEWRWRWRRTRDTTSSRIAMRELFYISETFRNMFWRRKLLCTNLIVASRRQIILILWMFAYLCTMPLSSKRRQLSCDDCVEDKRGDYQNCSVLYCVLQLCSIMWPVLIGCFCMIFLTRVSLSQIWILSGVFGMYFLLTVVSTSATDCLERLVSEWPVMLNMCQAGC